MVKERSILIIDDEEKILEVLKDYLEVKGYSVYIAANAVQALEILDKEPITLVILDLMLPDITGEELCKQIRKNSRIPIIMLTAKASENDMVEGLNIGADDYITKPFSLKTLYARIEAVIRRYTDEPLYNKVIYNEGDLEIDFDRYTVKKNNVEVKLTPNEYKILTTLAKHPKRVYTREELISSALGNDFDGFDRAIDSHIKNIRQKIEDNSKENIYIITVHGVGYKFGGE